MRSLAAWSWLGIVLCVAPVAAATEGPSVAAPSSGAEPPAGAEPSAGSEAQAAERGDSAPHLGLRAYEEALAARKLAPTQPLSAERLRAELAQAEASLLAGRVAEAIAAAAALVESKRFEPFREGPEGRGLRFVLGDALGRAGADELAIAYLGPLTQGDDVSARRAVRALVDHGLESGDPARFLEPVRGHEQRLPEELRGDVAYARGRAHERAGRAAEALGGLRQVGPRSRFWAQATYLSGLIEAERGRLSQAEELFCRVADPKLTPKEAPLFGGADFFEVRDLARLGLGRVAHETYRFDDAQYYYYLVPKDSRYLPEALYEAATTRYEAKDHRGAREYLDELVASRRSHPYEDERFILDAYVDLATCDFDAAEKKLQAFSKNYAPVHDAARRLLRDPTAMRRLLESASGVGDPRLANLGIDATIARRLVALLRVDEGQQRLQRRLHRLERHVAGLDRLEQDLLAARALLGGKRESGAVVTQNAEGLGASDADRLARVEAQAAEVGRLLREAEASRKVPKSEIEQLRGELEALVLQARRARTSAAPATEVSAGGGDEIGARLGDDLERLRALRAEASKTRAELERAAEAGAREVLRRLERRLERLLRRARMGRIELVLGKKRALEVEIEALSQGLLPPSMVDSLDVARYLRDDEEYWPDDGEDWADEYVGGEGLRESR